MKARRDSWFLIRLAVLASLLAAFLGFLLSHNAGTPPVHAFSAGPPAGYTGAPQEEPEACAECHVPPDAGTGKILITAPQTYVPGQTYPITVTQQNPDPTRLRWGFELTVLDTASDEKAGELQSTNGLTQVLNNAGPGSARQPGLLLTVHPSPRIVLPSTSHGPVIRNVTPLGTPAIGALANSIDMKPHWWRCVR